MTGNRVFIYFRNTTELSDWPRVNVSKWPNNPNGLKMTDGIGLLVGAKVYIEDDGDAGLEIDRHGNHDRHERVDDFDEGGN